MNSFGPIDHGADIAYNSRFSSRPAAVLRPARVGSLPAGCARVPAALTAPHRLRLTGPDTGARPARQKTAGDGIDHLRETARHRPADILFVPRKDSGSRANQLSNHYQIDGNK